MFLIMRRSLLNHQQAVADGALAQEGIEPGQDHRMLEAILQALLPFLAFYFAWKYFAQDGIAYVSRALDFATETAFNKHPLRGNVLDFSGSNILLAAAIVYVIRLVVKKLPDADRTPLRVARIIVAGYLECLWLFLAVLGLAGTADPGKWLRSRVVVVHIVHGWSSGVDHVLGVDNPFRHSYDAVAGVVHLAVTDLWSSAVQPLMWLTIVAVIYGRQLPDPEGPIGGENSRLARAGAVASRTPGFLRYVVLTITQDWRGRWVPVAKAFRLATHAGFLPFLAYVLAYAILDAACGWFWLGLREVIGPHPVDWWQFVYPPVSTGIDGLRTILRVCLLAAVYDRIVGVLAGYVQPRADEPEPVLTAETAGISAAPR
ncbi:MAG TPA: hypothetical protein VHC49_12805, partial [Mycobacteriales bacterium]|nr:hypothetical protein [Mycobacteriales bacterium]